MSLYEFTSHSDHLHRFVPYADNGGTVVAISGDDYTVIGADTRLSIITSIGTRSQKRLFQLSPHTVLGATGCWADILTVAQLMKSKMKEYEFEHRKPMSTPAAAQMMSTMLYYKRFFPYFSFTVLAGLDSDGKGCVYNFDPVGHQELSQYTAIGTARNQLIPVLDNQISNNNMTKVDKTPYPRQKAMSLLKDLFTAAAERDTRMGDSVLIITMTKDCFKEETFELRKD